MPIINKPLLAGKFDSTKAKFPYIGTPKIDGIRFLMVNGQAVSRTFKPIRNQYIQRLLSEYLPDGIDGELTSGNNFQDSTSAVMTIEGESEFKVWIFDYVNPQPSAILPFRERILNIPNLSNCPFDYEILSGSSMKTMEEINEYERICLEAGYEGVMLRDPEGTYKFGRSTVKDNILLKVKRFVDTEARIIGYEQKQSNQNEAEKDAFGRTKRSTSMAGQILCDTLGALIVKMDDGRIVKIGSGLNDEIRKEIWLNQEKYLNVLVKFKYFEVGVKDLPRHPVFLGFRDEDDL